MIPIYDFNISNSLKYFVIIFLSFLSKISFQLSLKTFDLTIVVFISLGFISLYSFTKEFHIMNGGNNSPWVFSNDF